MVQTKEKTVKGYLASLPEDRRSVIEHVRKVVRKNLPKGYVETINWGMICYEIPLAYYPETYNKQPLCYAALAAQKNYYSLYLPYYHDATLAKALREGFRKLGKKPNIGKCCVRFKKIDDIPLDVIAKLIAYSTPDEFIQVYEKERKIV